MREQPERLWHKPWHMLVLVNDVQVYVECLMMKAGVTTKNAMWLKPSLMFAQWKLGRVWGSTTKAAAPA